MKTKAVILKAINQLLEVQELEIPALKRGQVLVEVAYSGLCHSQLNEIRGLKGEDKFLPHTLGHEGSGIVLECGEGVTKVKRGDHVVLSWIKGEGLEGLGTQYEGRINSGPISTFLTHAVISENRLIPIPKEMPLREAALLGCAIPTGAGVVKNEMNVRAGQSFAVFGVGGVGLSALIAAKAAQASPLIAVDVSEDKLARAILLGATHTVNSGKIDPVAALLEITGGKGVDFIFEAAGKKSAMEQAFSSLKAPGLCVLAGNLPQGQTISIDPFDLIRGKKIVGTWGGKSRIDEDVKAYAALYLEKAISFEGMITHEVPLEEINALVSALEKGQVGRGVVRCASV